MEKQNHLPFEKWIYSEDPLTPEQNQALGEHLRSCESCRQIQASLKGVKALFSSVPSVHPAPGFTARWQARLEAEKRLREQRQRRQSWILFLTTGSSAAILLILMLSQAFSLLEDPIQILLWLAYRIIFFFSYLLSLQDFAVEFLRPAVTAIPLPFWILAVGVMTLISVLWVVALRLVTTSRRFVYES